MMTQILGRRRGHTEVRPFALSALACTHLPATRRERGAEGESGSNRPRNLEALFLSFFLSFPLFRDQEDPLRGLFHAGGKVERERSGGDARHVGGARRRTSEFVYAEGGGDEGGGNVVGRHPARWRDADQPRLRPRTPTGREGEEGGGRSEAKRARGLHLFFFFFKLHSHSDFLPPQE